MFFFPKRVSKRGYKPSIKPPRLNQQWPSHLASITCKQPKLQTPERAIRLEN